jgi:hypothetical protein
MEYDNSRDRFSYGYDAGVIIDGEVVYDENKREYVIMDDDGIAFSSQSVLSGLLGQKVRITCITLESIENIQKMLANTPLSQDSFPDKE